MQLRKKYVKVTTEKQQHLTKQHPQIIFSKRYLSQRGYFYSVKFMLPKIIGIFRVIYNLSKIENLNFTLITSTLTDLNCHENCGFVQLSPISWIAAQISSFSISGGNVQPLQERTRGPAPVSFKKSYSQRVKCRH